MPSACIKPVSLSASRLAAALAGSQTAFKSSRAAVGDFAISGSSS